jgi:hypothetical protein
MCAGLVIVDDEVSTVWLIHYTTQHYLDSIQADRFPHAQTEITLRCLNYLFFSKFHHLPQDDDQVEDILKEHPFLAYSQYCLMHAAGGAELALQNQIIEFLQQASRWRDFWHAMWRFEPVSCVEPWCNHEWPEFASSLWISASAGLQATTTYLLAQETIGSDENLKDSALYIASCYGHLFIVQLLIEKGANLTAQGGYYGTALQAAACEGHNSMVQLLINEGADVDAQGGHFGTALQAAAYKGNISVVQLLIEKGAYVNAQAGEYRTALQAAIQQAPTSVVHLLIANGAQTNLLINSMA